MAHLKAVAPSDKPSAVELTLAHIRALKARGTDKLVRLADSIEPGLYLQRDGRNGHLSFIYRGRVRGAQGAPHVVLKLGDATDARSLSKARARAIEVRQQLAQGINPVAARRIKAAEVKASDKALTKEQEAKQWTPAFALKHMLEWRASRPDKSLHFRAETIEFYERGIGYLGKLANVPIVDIRADDIRKALDKIDGAAKPSKAKRALSGVINHALKRLDLNIANPVARLDRGEFKAPPPRVSYIAESMVGEYVEKLVALPSLPQLKGKQAGAERARDYMMLTLLYGTRMQELMAMQWNWIDWKAGTITLPASAVKQKKTHTLPLTEWTRTILEARRKANKRGSVYVFPGDRNRQLNDDDELIDQPVTNVRRTMLRAFGAGFRLHDMRRTLITHCSTLGIHGPRLKAIVGHARADVTEMYDQRELDQVARDLTTYHEWVLGQHADYLDAEHSRNRVPDAEELEDMKAEDEWLAQQPPEPPKPARFPGCV